MPVVIAKLIVREELGDFLIPVCFFHGHNQASGQWDEPVDFVRPPVLFLGETVE